MSYRRDERSERSPQSSKEWDDVWVVSTPCKLLIMINIAVLLELNHLLSCVAIFLIFVIFGGIFGMLFNLMI
jgi:hypothetical protein